MTEVDARGAAPVSGKRVVIVGASLAGLTTAEALRAEGFSGEIVVIGEESSPPYSRPPLSKQILLRSWEPAQAALRSTSELEALDVEWRLGVRASGIDQDARFVVAAGERIAYDEIVIATGVSARRPTMSGAESLHVLRTMSDVENLLLAFEHAGSAVVIGGGVLGSEIASAAASMGMTVSLIGRSAHLSLGTVGNLLSERLVRLHESRGVNLRLSSEATSIGGATAAARSSVRLTTGEEIGGDVIVAATGGEPSTDWLLGSTLDISDGVACDAYGSAGPGVWAVGDVAKWAGGATHAARRSEHQTNAIEQALSVAQSITGGGAANPPVPFFWSELHGVRIQAYGHFDDSTPLTTIDGDAEHPVLGSIIDGRVFGVVGWGAPRAFRAARSLVDDTLTQSVSTTPVSSR